MAQAETNHVALLSIHPVYAKEIFEGRKKVELRRVGFARIPRFIVVYVTKPIGKVAGFFEVAQVTEAHPEEIWSSYHSVTGLTKAAYDAYFADRSKAVAIEISSVHRLEEPVELRDIDTALQPPQSFQYLGPSALEMLNEEHLLTR